ncbi:pilus assembly protein CpaE [Sphingomonas sp. MAH-20]|uniref:Pilus assembly protein CpaE n=1 Tax=Sphingomonas horti TaxID=2682842 RepID=A0A6I4IY72_9SPHN|nr:MULTISPECIES: pilus assembly protein CpaE [Sphingomonas]MBA2918180.1 pilus assembly protein CpaE [Sphingomonas sp. CGMCC 1.13658]MVO77149.1 pilus assembly protein CpaE [Sphingomonas horti]
MNAPWSPTRSAALRDPFVAYVSDDSAADAIRPIAVEMGWSPEKVVRGGLRAAIQNLAVAASPNVLLVDLSDASDPLNDINALAEVCEPGTVVIATGVTNDVRLYRDLIASGIQDYLLKPLHPDQLRDAFAGAQAVFNAPKSFEPQQDRPHLMMAVMGSRGGAGASTVAASLAWLFGEKDKRSAALLDLDVHFGTDALALDLEPGRGLTDAIENPSRIDGLFLERALVRVNEKLAVLSAEAPINQPLLTDGSAFYQLQEEIRAGFECTVIDLPRHMLVQHPMLVQDLNSVVLVTEITLAAARDCIRFLAWFKSHAPQASVILVANKVAASGVPELSRKDFEASIERKLDFVIPYDQKLAAQAAKLGKPLAEVGKGAKLGQALHGLAGRLISASADDAEKTAGEAGKSLLGKLGEFKLKLGKPAKA